MGCSPPCVWGQGRTHLPQILVSLLELRWTRESPELLSGSPVCWMDHGGGGGGQGRGPGLQGDWPGRACLLVSREKLPSSARADPSTCPHPASLPSSMGVSLSFLLHWNPLLPVSRKPTKGKRCWSEWELCLPCAGSTTVIWGRVLSFRTTSHITSLFIDGGGKVIAPICRAGPHLAPRLSQAELRVGVLQASGAPSPSNNMQKEGNGLVP